MSDPKTHNSGLELSKRLFLSPPHIGTYEQQFVKEAFKSNYIEPLGPMVDAFEREFSEYTGIKHCVALSSGTASMHLTLRVLSSGFKVQSCGVWKPEDEVFTSTLTFFGSVSPVKFFAFLSLAQISEECEDRRSAKVSLPG